MNWFDIYKPHVEEFEGLRLEAYDDLAPDRKLKAGDSLKGTLTIGYGHTGPDVFVGQTITEADAERFLREDTKEAETAVDRRVKVTLNPYQKAALVSFTYNVGEGNLARSTLLRFLNSGDYMGAANQPPRWRKSKGQVLKGLVRRRAAEREMFLTPFEVADDIDCDHGEITEDEMQEIAAKLSAYAVELMQEAKAT